MTKTGHPIAGEQNKIESWTQRQGKANRFSLSIGYIQNFKFTYGDVSDDFLIIEIQRGNVLKRNFSGSIYSISEIWNTIAIGNRFSFPNISLKFHFDCSFIKLDAVEVYDFFHFKKPKHYQNRTPDYGRRKWDRDMKLTASARKLFFAIFLGCPRQVLRQV